MKLRMCGIRNNEGGGIHFGSFVDALKRVACLRDAVEEINVLDNDALAAALATSSSSDVNVWFFPHSWLERFKGTHVVWAIFETDKPPKIMEFILRHNADVVWTPSAWGRDVLVANGLPAETIDIIPEGVQTRVFNPYLRGRIDKSRQPLRFLSIGKFDGRKSYRELLEAFKSVFMNSTQVELGIKADWFLMPSRTKEVARLVTSFGLSNVRLYAGDWSPEQLAALYCYSDAFVLPTKAEAWGLPLLEAAATGLPIITTYYSGQTEFLQHIQSSVLKIDFSLERVADPEFRHLLGVAEHDDIGRWAQPSVASIADCMKALQRDRDHYASRARENSFVVMEKFSWEAAANKALRVLDERKLLSDDLFLNTYVTPQPYRLHPMEPSQVHQGDIAKHMPRTNLARNAPCFCGSGKKYKHCHGKLA
jgi:glycosyltransferase involved in cell wall biosynthesis